MIRSLLLVLLLTFNLFAAQVTYKIKAKQYGDIVKVKARIKSPMLGESSSKQKGTEPDYLMHIIAKVGEHIVYDAKIGSSWSKNPLFKFSYRNADYGDQISIEATDNKGKITIGKAMIKKSNFDGKVDKNINMETAKYTAVQKKLTSMTDLIRPLQAKLISLYQKSLPIPVLFPLGLRPI